MGVQAIILIEDSVRYYSSFLPVIYAELMRHAQSLVPEGINLSHKLMRLQARPKILLCTTFEEAWRVLRRATRTTSSASSRTSSSRRTAGSRREAGLEFARRVRERQPDVPIMLQSSRGRERGAGALGRRGVPAQGIADAAAQLQRFMIEQLRLRRLRVPPAGRPRRRPRARPARARGAARAPCRPRASPTTASATTSRSGSRRGPSSRWPHRLRPRKVSDFRDRRAPAPRPDRRDPSTTAASTQPRRRRRLRPRDVRSGDASFCRIGGGSLGGKGRGLAFVDLLLEESRRRSAVPRASHRRAAGGRARHRRLRRVSRARRPARLRARRVGRRTTILRPLLEARVSRQPCTRDLAAFLEARPVPAGRPLVEPARGLAVSAVRGHLRHVHGAERHRRRATCGSRSCATADLARLRVDVQPAREAYLRASPYRLEEEKMAVVMQRSSAPARGERFYPDLAGVARSHNFYALPPLRPEDGIAAVALGLGATVVGGETCFRFCPRYPRHVVQFSSVEDVLRNSQRDVLRAASWTTRAERRRGFALERGFDLESGGARTARWRRVGSTYSPENDACSTASRAPGVRLVSFAPILKHGLFPLAEILDALLRRRRAGRRRAGGDRVRRQLPGAAGDAGVRVLQLRPVGRSASPRAPSSAGGPRGASSARARSVLGHGTIDDVRDVVVIDSTSLRSARTREIARRSARSTPSSRRGGGRTC